jgi:hypothetical protein
MAKDQEEINLPGTNPSNRKTSVDLLPKYFRTDANKKFLAATLDPLIQDGVIDKLNGYLGRKTSKAFSVTDNYIPDITDDRENYQLEPALVVKDNNQNTTFYKDYNDYVNQLRAYGGNVDNHSRLNTQEFYSLDPRVDWDKLTNYREYYWLSQGPSTISIAGQEKGITSTYSVQLVNDGDNNAYVLSPDGLTRNPTIKLYRGQTYNFEVDQKNNPFAIKTKKVKSGFDFNDGVTNNGAEKGVVSITITQNTPDILHYVNLNDLSASGLIQVLSIDENTKIDVDNEIIGKKQYQLKSGHYLSNGMKIDFVGDVTPSTYADGNWYVEGVGKEIVLISEQTLETLYPTQTITELQFDDVGFDVTPFDQTSDKAKDYITINRSAYDGNQWSRANRWFHKDVIETSFEISGLAPVIDQSARANRPIIEFIPGLQLFNNGWNRIQDVDLVDTVTTDIMSQIEGTTGYYVDNINLVAGMRVIFTADNDLLIKDKVFTVKFVRFNNDTIITLVPDAIPVSSGSTLVIKSGNKNQGKQYWFNGNIWTSAQQKEDVNQPPLFDLYDSNSVSLSDPTVYGSTEFVGNKVFSYREGTGTADTVLGFPITYLNISNIGDIVFDCDLLTDTYNYNINEKKYSIIAKDSFLKVYNRIGGFGYHSAWERAITDSKQFVIRHFIADLNRNNFEIDVYNKAASITDLEIQVFVNNKIVYNYELVTQNDQLFINFITDLVENDSVIIKTHTATNNKNKNGYYEFPLNLQNNPNNQDPQTITLGEILDHVETIVNNSPEVTGDFPGTTNLRDVGNASKYGSRFVKHSGPINIALYHLTNKDTNIIKALDNAAKSYDKFQKSFLDYITNNSTDSTVNLAVDQILNELLSDTDETQSWYNSGMVPFRAFNEIEHIVIDASFSLYGITEMYEPYKHQDKALLVYINDFQITLGDDYEFINDNFVKINIDIQPGDVIKIREYETLVGNYIPPTPAKLGLLPKYKPSIYVDSTLQEPASVIQGHDGSIIRAFDDYRDDLILELERRIFNNIKVEYTDELINFFEFKPGGYRKTDYQLPEVNNILRPLFLKWHKNLNVSYTDNSWYETGNAWNNNYTTGSFGSKPLPGHWRGIYNYWYDTDRPHITPWEMLGFSIEPTWWVDTYGPAPYTSENLILWNDLQDGRIKEPGAERIDTNFSRPQLMDIIPVDQYGNLIDPIASNIAQNYDTLAFADNFNFGDYGPVENAWRRSSGYRFSLLCAWLLTKPAQVFGVYLDRAHTSRDISGIIKYAGEFPTLSGLSNKVSNTVLASGLIDYVNNWLYQSGSSFINNYIFNLANASNQLGAKLAGYTEKQKFRLILDSRTPLNEGNVFVPDENYEVVLNTSSPVEVLSYSGVIIEKASNGFILKGYDQKFPFFNYKPIITSQSDSKIVIGAVSEGYMTWAEERTYIKGKIVQYNSVYYRCREDHLSTTEFDVDKFSKLASLPTIGGRDYFHRTLFSDSYSTVDYGTVFPTVQDVVDFFYGYSAYLEDAGFVFDNYDNENQILHDWDTSIKEFVFWTTQNWAAGTVISLSPGATQFSVEIDYTNVDDLLNDFYDYEIYNSSGTRININDLNISRNNSKFSISSNNDDGIYFARLHLVQTEHVLLIDNKTVFNDIIYDTPAGYRQERIKVLGYKTVLWDGGLTTPGFIYDEIVINNWEPFNQYRIGDIVKNKEFLYSAKKKVVSAEYFDEANWTQLSGVQKSQLLPNFDYRAEQFTDFFDLDTDNFDSEQQRLAQHTIGYQKRKYLENIINDDVSQYKFYQGMILDKGTKNVLTKMFDKLSSADKESLEFYEEWAIRVGQYGAVDSFVEVEYLIDEKKVRLDPQPFELVNIKDSSNTDLVYRFTNDEAYVTYDGYTNTPFKKTTKLPNFIRTAGNVDSDDVTFSVKETTDILNLNIDDFRVGSTVWVSFYGTTWNILRLQDTSSNVLSISPSGKDVIVTLNKIVTLTVGDIVGIKNVSDEADKFYKVKSIADYTITLETDKKLDNAIDMEDSSLGIFYNFVDARIPNISKLNEITPDVGFQDGELVWVDGEDGNWKVYQKNKVYNTTELLGSSTNENTQGTYGAAVAVDAYNRDFIVADPSGETTTPVPVYESDGITVDRYVTTSKSAVYVYARSNDITAHRLIQTIRLPDNLNKIIFDIPLNDRLEQPLYKGYGKVISTSPDTKFLAIAIPDASNIPSDFTGEWSALTTYADDEVVLYNGVLYQATEDGLNSTPPNLVSAWEAIGHNPIDGQAITNSGFANQGWVGMYIRSGSGSYSNLFNMQSPIPQANQRFGETIRIETVAANDYRMFVSAPGHNGTGQIFVYDWNLATGGKWVWQPTKSLPAIDRATGTDNVEVISTAMDYGYDVKTSNSGNRVFVSAPYANNVHFEEYKGNYNIAIAYAIDNVIKYSGDYWKKLTVSAAGTTPVAGINWEMLSVDSEGAYGKLYVYDYVDNTYQLAQVISEFNLDNTESTISDAFAKSVDVTPSGNTLVIGVPNYDSDQVDTGKVIVFNYVENAYSITQTLTGNATENQEFGHKVSISDDTLAIGSRRGNQVDRITILPEGTTFDSDATYISDIYTDTGKVDVYSRYQGSFTYEDTIILGDKDLYDLGSVLIANNNHVIVGVPNYNEYSGGVIDFWKQYGSSSWKTHRQAIFPADVTNIKSSFLYDTRKNVLAKELDIIDPLQGKIAGPADQEIDYKTFWDPAVYTIGSDTVNVDETGAWDASNIGKVWWDLSTARFVNYHQNSALYRANNWSKLSEFANIDVYEWVSSKYKPSTWDELSASDNGLALGISGVSKYGDTVYSVAREYDTVSKNFTQKYMFWVKQKTTTPNIENRQLSISSIAALIADPKSQGYAHIAITSDNSFVLYNCKQFLNDNDVALNIRFWNTEVTDRNIHRQYQILTEGLDISSPNDTIINKWFDSLVGFTPEGLAVPNPNLSVKQSYGILNKPRQGMFKNRLEAFKQLIEQTNYVFSKNILVDDFNLAPFFEKEPLPNEFSRLYDLKINDDLELSLIATGKLAAAEVDLRIEDGKIVDVIITNAGRGYLTPPAITVVGQGAAAELESSLDAFGRISSVTIKNAGSGYLDDTYASVRQYTVLNTDVNSTGKWGLYNYSAKSKSWQIVRMQSYDVTKYWNYKDWYAEGFDENTPIDFLIDGSFQLADITPRINQLVKITNIGSSGQWLLLRRNAQSNEGDINLNYQVVGRQDATIEISNALYDYNENVLGYDGISYEEIAYDSIPITESRKILEALRTNIFVDNLQVEFNNLFFNTVRYVLTEQLAVDWIFKTSFVKAKHNVGELDQRITYKNDSLASYEQYVNEVKPYRTKVREFISNYTKTETVNMLTSDFDLQSNNNIRVIDNQLQLNGNTTLDVYPNKSWKDNHTYGVASIEIQNAGSGYQAAPELTIIGGGGTGAAARAFIGRNGSITNIIMTTNGTGYYSMPEIVINGSVDDTGTAARLVAILDNSTIRKNDITIKFDRITGDAEVTTLDVTETFLGTGILTAFNLKWPIDVRKGLTTVTINGIELLESEFTVSNSSAFENGLTTTTGHIEIPSPPDAASTLVIEYKKDIGTLTAADRINYYYDPAVGQLSKDTSALMRGVDYGGVSVTGFGFEPSGGWGTDGTTWDNVNWEGSDEAFTDITVYSDLSEVVYTFATAPEVGETWNVYVNGIRIDASNFVAATGNIVMQSIVGDGITTAFTIPISNVPSIVTGDGTDDQIVLRRINSDGSFIPVGVDIDSVIDGRDLGYTQATGYNPEDINIDGDGFVTPTTSSSLEEQLSGHVSEAIDMYVYNLAKSGGPQVNSISYVADGSTKSFAYISDPQSKDALIIKVNNKILRPTDYKYTPNFAAYTDFLVAYESNIAIKQARLPIAQASLLESTNSLTVLEDQLTDILADIIQINVQLSFWNNEVVFYTSEVARIDGEIAAADPLSNQFIILQGERTTALQQLSAAQNEVSNYQDDLQIAEDTRDSISASVPAIENTIATLTSEIATLETDIDILETDIQSVGDYLINPGKTIILNTTPVVNDVITIMTFGTNGNDIILIDNFIGDGSTSEFVTPLKYTDALRVFATVNGKQQTPRVKESTDEYEEVGRLVLEFDPTPDANATVKYTVYNNESPDYSYIQKQNITTDFSTLAYNLDDTPYGASPSANFIVAFKGDKLLNGGYTQTAITTASNAYQVDLSDFADGEFSADHVEIYVGGQLKALGVDYQIDFGLNTIDFIPGKITAGQELKIFIMTRADYYVINNQFVLATNPEDNEDIMIMTFFNTDVFDTNHVSKSVLSRRSLTIDSKWYRSSVAGNAGIILLDSAVSNENYVMIAINGDVLTPHRDYRLIENGTAVQVDIARNINSTDNFYVIVFDYDPVEKSIAFRQFTDNLNRTHYKAINNTKMAKLAAPLNWYDTSINVDDASNLDTPNPRKNIPGIIFIGAERIEYMQKNGNVLSQLRRGTVGTATQAVYHIDTELLNQGKSLTIDYTDTEMTSIFYGDGSTQEFLLPYAVTVNTSTVRANNKWNRIHETDINVADIPDSYGQVDDIEVFVGGKRLSKVPCTLYNPNKDQLSPAGDSALPADFSATVPQLNNAGSKIPVPIRFTVPPAMGSKIVIKRKQGVIWQERGESLADAKNSIAKFLRAQEVSFPK